MKEYKIAVDLTTKELGKSMEPYSWHILEKDDVGEDPVWREVANGTAKSPVLAFGTGYAAFPRVQLENQSQ